MIFILKDGIITMDSILQVTMKIDSNNQTKICYQNKINLLMEKLAGRAEIQFC